MGTHDTLVSDSGDLESAFFRAIDREASCMNHTVSSLWAAVSLARRDLLEFLRDRRTVAVTLLLPMITYPLVALSSSLGVRTGLQTTAEQQSATSAFTCSQWT